MNNLLWLLKPLKKKLGGEFYICPAVFYELIQRPLVTKKYKFEALQVLPFIFDETIKKVDGENITSKANELLNLANNCFYAKGNNIKIVYIGEMEAIATALVNNCNTLAIDERATRMLIEEPLSL